MDRWTGLGVENGSTSREKVEREWGNRGCELVAVMGKAPRRSENGKVAPSHKRDIIHFLDSVSRRCWCRVIVLPWEKGSGQVLSSERRTELTYLQSQSAG